MVRKRYQTKPEQANGDYYFHLADSSPVLKTNIKSMKPINLKI